LEISLQLIQNLSNYCLRLCSKSKITVLQADDLITINVALRYNYSVRLCNVYRYVLSTILTDTVYTHDQYYA
jgi:hypothetical protein